MSEWISVKKRLPSLTNNAGVLLSDNLLIIYKRINSPYYDPNKNDLHIFIGYYSVFEDGTEPEWNLTEPLQMNYFPYDKKYIDVLYWMPLPEPPEIK